MLAQPATAPQPALTVPLIDGLLVSVDENCALHCKFCFRADFGNTALDLPTYARALSRGKELGATSVCLTGGEPTDHPDFVDFVKVAVQFGLACSVVTAARSPHRIKALAKAAGLLSHVTVSADSAGALRVGRTARPISSAWRAFEALNHGRASLHVTLWQVEPIDLQEITEIANRYGVEVEISPLIPAEAEMLQIGPDGARAQHLHDMTAVSQAIGLTDRFHEALGDLQLSMAGQLHRSCASTRVYVSPKGMLRMCPYDRSNEVHVGASRQEIRDKLRAMRESGTPVGNSCALVCREPSCHE
jgi:MoaA/NifB/PqqE/SkfB family radical SAM enzyme